MGMSMAIETAEGGDDIVEGEFRAPRKVVVTVGEAASEYFEWSEEREQRRRKRAQKPSGAHSAAPLSTKRSPPFDAAARSAVTQFVFQVTSELPVAEITPDRMAAFQEAIGTNTADVAARLRPVKDFLHFCWKARGYTDVNLGKHLRVKSARAAAAAARGNQGRKGLGTVHTSLSCHTRARRGYLAEFLRRGGWGPGGWRWFGAVFYLVGGVSVVRFGRFW